MSPAHAQHTQNKRTHATNEHLVQSPAAGLRSSRDGYSSEMKPKQTERLSIFQWGGERGFGLCDGTHEGCFCAIRLHHERGAVEEESHTGSRPELHESEQAFSNGKKHFDSTPTTKTQNKSLLVLSHQ